VKEYPHTSISQHLAPGQLPSLPKMQEGVKWKEKLPKHVLNTVDGRICPVLKEVLHEMLRTSAA
jgi:hypothetical protein